ncbi:MAG TPA: uracil-DNA glycosylase, partial [Telmatospirillum sp.]|nr:uracil-DNA glycosylase [Telmatospirillum sp.]
MTSVQTTPILSPAQLLRWYLDAGVDEAIGEHALDRYALAVAARAETTARTHPASVVPTTPTTSLSATSLIAPAPPQSGQEAPRVSSAHLAMECQTLDDLKAAMERYDGCALRRTCQRTVFADGNPEARVMLIGEAPGADEDRL